MISRGAHAFAYCTLAVLCALLTFPTLHAQTDVEFQQRMEGVQIDQKLGEVVPLSLSFTDDHGKGVRLVDYFERNSGRPVLITLNYSNCPAFCNAQLNSMARALKYAKSEMGVDYTLLTVSIDPQESYETAAKSKAKHLEIYSREGGDEGWHFLTCTNQDDSNVKALADALGFRYRYDEHTGEYLHRAAVMVCTPDGRISRYLAIGQHQGETFDEAIRLAAKNEIAPEEGEEDLSFFESCIRLIAGENVAPVLRVVRVIGVVLVFGLVGFVGFWTIRGRKQIHTP